MKLQLSLNVTIHIYVYMCFYIYMYVFIFTKKRKKEKKTVYNINQMNTKLCLISFKHNFIFEFILGIDVFHRK